MSNKEKKAEAESREVAAGKSDADTAAKHGNAREQFGGQAHVLKKQKEAHIASLEQCLRDAKSKL
jgi:hypothetical protein